MEQEILRAAEQAILDYDVSRAEQVAKEGLASGLDPAVLLERGFIKGITRIGELFGEGEIYLPELILAGDAMKAATAVCEAAIKQGEGQVKKRVVIGTVAGDIHDIGKSIVASFLAANGFEVIDIGRDLKDEDWVTSVRELKPEVLGASALLTSTIDGQRRLIEALKQAGLRDKVKVIIGGAPVTQKWADQIGADAYGENAALAVKKVKELTATK